MKHIITANPLVSIVIPFYNAQKTVAEALHSVLGQTYTHFEVIMINDGSTDQSVRIVEDMLAVRGEHRVTLIHQENAGVASAQNRAFNLARGEYIALLDADDIWHECKLARHVAHLNAKKEVGISYSYSQFISESGQNLPGYQKPKLHHITLKDLLCRHPVSNGSTTVFRRDLLHALLLSGQVGRDGEYVDERLERAHDIEMWVRAGVKSPYAFEGLGEVLTYYRISKNSYASHFEKKIKSFDRALEAISVYAPQLVVQYAKLARAYQRRYLARKAISFGDAKNRDPVFLASGF